MTGDRSGLIPFKTARWQGVIRSDLQELAEDPVDALLSAEGEILVERGNVTTHCTTTRWGKCILRHDRAPRWRLYRSSLVLHTADIHQQLASAGIRVAEVYLAARRIKGPSEEIIASELINGQSLNEKIWPLHKTPKATVPLLHQTGEAVGKLHAAGFMHGDLIPGNLLLPDDGGPLVFIDNERTRHLPDAFLDLGRRRNLAQMLFRLCRGLPHQVVKTFFDAYYEQFRLPEKKRRRELAQVYRKTRMRLARRSEN